jgi:hypothetical protein
MPSISSFTPKELMADPKLSRHFKFFMEFLQKLGRDMLRELGVIDAGNLDAFSHLVAVGAVHDLKPVVQKIVSPYKFAPDADRPGGRGYVNRKVLLDLVDDLEHVAGFAVHLVAEGQDRQIAQAADLEQLAGLAFYALGAVDHHDCGVDGGQGAIGVFGKVAVAGGVDKVEAVVPEVEGHCAGRDRDPAIRLDLHEVRPRAPGIALGAHLARHLDGAAEQQELFGQRGFPGVGVRNDRKGPAAGDFGGKGGTVRHARRYRAANPCPQPQHCLVTVNCQEYLGNINRTSGRIP